MLTLATILSLLPPEMRELPRAWAGYTISYLPLVGGASNAKQATSTQDNSTFILTRIKAYCTTNAVPPVENATPQATFSLSIGTLELFADKTQQHLAPFAVSQNDNRGHELEFPLLVEANTALNAVMTNLTAVDIMVRLHLYGLRLWPGPKPTGAL
jgi:hypothetical protein